MFRWKKMIRPLLSFTSLILLFIFVVPVLATPVPTPTPTPQIQLGGLSLNKFCQSLGQTSANLNGNAWRCQPSGDTLDMTQACKWQYDTEQGKHINPNIIAWQLDLNNPYSWQCFGDPIPSPSPTGTLAGTFSGFKLYDDGLDGSDVVCPEKKSNSSGVSLSNNFDFSDNLGKTELIWNTYNLATIIPPSTAGGSGVSSNSINESSQVVGQSVDNNLPNSFHGDAFIWQNGIITVIAHSPGGGTGAFTSDINNKGYAVGFNGEFGGGFLWKDGVMSGLTGLGGRFVIPDCINDQNNIIGTSWDSNSQQHHVHWVPVTPPTDKNPLVPFVAEYFDNQNLTGTPKITRLDPKINFATNGSFDSSLPVDHFSARWSKTQFMKAGKYSFTIKSDDGIRFWVDSTLVVDDWTNHATRVYTPNILVSEGNHSFKVEYYENTGGAVAIFNEDFPARSSSLPAPITIP